MVAVVRSGICLWEDPEEGRGQWEVRQPQQLPAAAVS